MVPRHGAGLGISRIVVADDKAVHGEGARPARHLFRPAVDHRLDGRLRGVVDPFARDGRKADPVQLVHPRPPGDGCGIGMDECERNPLEIPPPQFRDVLERKRAAREVARIRIVLLRRGAERREVRIGNHRLAAHDEVPRRRHGLRNAVNAGGEVRDVRADMTVTARDDLRQATAVVGDDEREAVELPADPNRAPLRPLRDLGDLLRLRERERGELVGLLLPLHGVRADAVRR